ncbi:restriction endonuclease [Roseofilum sp. BLCC_M154]|uniref:Restriction endonuclease n=1 Tax=Roseofilum acuticapitatum BLCC-M154 TaxID=3022444 RepID=A0ABT7AWJ1_9CYAN|nr:restriction endonuclease [Roseofilum acuticapitatum]MDJ1170794.1 restriction endonuclease [Roseofilum acuticapitatum BLCC-M154]
MAIPDFQAILLPLLKLAGDQKRHSMQEAIQYLANTFQLTDEERKELLPSGKQAVFDNRVGWARTYLKKAGLLESPARSFFQITNRGVDLLQTNPSKINTAFLKKYPEFREFKMGNSSKDKSASDNDTNLSISEGEDQGSNQQTPEEILEYSYQELRSALAQELLEKVKSCSPSFFERLVVELLVKMGYGGSIKEAGRAMGKTGDEGIDGMIKEDRLGLDRIYIQAKRWQDSVGRPEIQKFVGALAGQGANKGIFITTSKFTEQAKTYSPKNDTKVVLIDGAELAEYMIDFDLGVSTVSEYKLKKIDTDYFEAD